MGFNSGFKGLRHTDIRKQVDRVQQKKITRFFTVWFLREFQLIC